MTTTTLMMMMWMMMMRLLIASGIYLFNISIIKLWESFLCAQHTIGIYLIWVKWLVSTMYVTIWMTWKIQCSIGTLARLAKWFYESQTCILIWWTYEEKKEIITSKLTSNGFGSKVFQIIGSGVFVKEPFNQNMNWNSMQSALWHRLE